jgi:hypothetical protein
MGKWFTPNSVCHFLGLEGTKNHSSDYYFSLTNLTGITCESKDPVKYFSRIFPPQKNSIKASRVQVCWLYWTLRTDVSKAQ